MKRCIILLMLLCISSFVSAGSRDHIGARKYGHHRVGSYKQCNAYKHQRIGASREQAARRHHRVGSYKSREQHHRIGRERR